MDIDITRYEALVRNTAAMIAQSGVEMEYDDICQRLRIKAWKALEAFSAKRDRNQVGKDRFVFACLTNEKKDILKKVKRNETYIEDLAPQGDDGYENGHLAYHEFEACYLMESPDQAFRSVEEEMPLIPSTLNRTERQIVHFLYLGYDYGEIATMLSLPRNEVAPLVRGIREKMADWKPSEVDRFRGRDAVAEPGDSREPVVGAFDPPLVSG